MTIVGTIVAAALGWTLLSFALSLPFMLGVFFFMLFGLFVGAAMYRVAAHLMPVEKNAVVTATLIASLCGWSTAVIKEGIDYPNDFVKQAQKKVHIPNVDGAGEKVKAELHSFIVDHLNTSYPPGGIIGYLRMAASGGAVRIDDLPTRQPRPIVIAPRAAPLMWWIRNILCVFSFYIAIRAVTIDLCKPRTAATACNDTTADKTTGGDITTDNTTTGAATSTAIDAATDPTQTSDTPDPETAASGNPSPDERNRRSTAPSRSQL